MGENHLLNAEINLYLTMLESFILILDKLSEIHYKGFFVCMDR